MSTDLLAAPEVWRDSPSGTFSEGEMAQTPSHSPGMSLALLNLGFFTFSRLPGKTGCLVRDSVFFLFCF